jgi:beta-N-acetylhexosaminidase
MLLPPAVLTLIFSLLAGPIGTAPAGSVPGGLSAAQLAGQRVIYSYHGSTPPQSLIQDIQSGQAAGVIFFGENITSKAQIRSVIRTLKRANQQSPVARPLLLMTDQEGGPVRRLPGPPARSAKQVGESSDPASAAREQGAAAAENLSGVGMNVNLAPVLGVYRHSGGFLDRYQRSFGTDAGEVGKAGAAFVHGSRSHGVLPTAKHFPGLGAASAQQNTDARPVTLQESANTLRHVDEHPYRDAIRAGVPIVMSSWAVYPSLDPDRPAGLSSTILHGELRDRLGYQGVTITDALEAGALKSYGDAAHRGVLAAKAGQDLILASARNVSQGDSVRKALAAALRNGELPRGHFDAAVERIGQLRASLR